MTRRNAGFCVAMLATLFVVMGPQLVDAVLVAPHAVFIDHRVRTGEITLLNTGTEPEEVTVDLQFGYPDNDSLGNVFVRLFEETNDTHPSAATFVRAFPKQMRLAPGARQTVRLLATPPSDLADGEYWSRVIVTSRGGVVPVGGADQAVAAGVTLEIRTIISLTYRKGDVNTGVTLEDISMNVEGDSLVAWIGLQRQGNAAFLGQVAFDVRDANGRTALEWSTPIAVFYELTRRYTFPIDSIAPGSYTVHVNVNTKREDFADRSVVLPADSIVRSVGIEVPAR